MKALPLLSISGQMFL